MNEKAQVRISPVLELAFIVHQHSEQETPLPAKWHFPLYTAKSYIPSLSANLCQQNQFKSSTYPQQDNLAKLCNSLLTAKQAEDDCRFQKTLVENVNTFPLT